MGTARDLITRSMKLIGALSDGETASASEESDALLALNEILDSWSTESLIIPAKTREQFNLVASQSSYTMGPSGNFNTTRPLQIENALIQTGSPAFEFPIQILNKDEWAQISVKTLTGTLPIKIYAEGTYPLETINLWPVPSSIVALVLYSWKPLTQLQDVNTVIQLPPGYLRALRFNLAVEIASEYGSGIDDRIMQIADESKGNIKRMNIKPLYLATDEATLGVSRPFNWLTGE